MTQTAHTPTPWVCAPSGMRDRYSQAYAIAQRGEKNLIAGLFDDVLGRGLTAKANAAFIVKACNAHDDMIDTIECFILDHDNGLAPSIDRLRALLTRVQP